MKTFDESPAINATALTLNFCQRFKAATNSSDQFCGGKDFCFLPICQPIPKLGNGFGILDLVIRCHRSPRSFVGVIYKLNDLLISEVHSFMKDDTTSSDSRKHAKKARSAVNGLIQYYRVD